MKAIYATMIAAAVTIGSATVATADVAPKPGANQQATEMGWRDGRYADNHRGDRDNRYDRDRDNDRDRYDRDRDNDRSRYDRDRDHDHYRHGNRWNRGPEYIVRNGRLYEKKRGKYELVRHPYGKVIDELPRGARLVRSHGRNLYVADGLYFEQTRRGRGYEVVRTPYRGGHRGGWWHFWG